jgi:hypothetical protein
LCERENEKRRSTHACHNTQALCGGNAMVMRCDGNAIWRPSRYVTPHSVRSHETLPSRDLSIRAAASRCRCSRRCLWACCCNIVRPFALLSEPVQVGASRQPPRNRHPMCTHGGARTVRRALRSAAGAMLLLAAPRRRRSARGLDGGVKVLVGSDAEPSQYGRVSLSVCAAHVLELAVALQHEHLQPPLGTCAPGHGAFTRQRAPRRQRAVPRIPEAAPGMLGTGVRRALRILFSLWCRDMWLDNRSIFCVSTATCTSLDPVSWGVRCHFWMVSWMASWLSSRRDLRWRMRRLRANASGTRHFGYAHMFRRP